MTTFMVSIVINQPGDVVVKALMDPENFPFWQKDLERFEVIRGAPGEVGSIGHLHYRAQGRSYIMEDKLIYCEPGKNYTSQVSGDVITAQVETTLHSTGNETEMSVTWTGKGKILFLKLFLPLLRGRMIKQSRVELETFKKLIETRGSRFGDRVE